MPSRVGSAVVAASATQYLSSAAAMNGDSTIHCSASTPFFATNDLRFGAPDAAAAWVAAGAVSAS